MHLPDSLRHSQRPSISVLWSCVAAMLISAAAWAQEEAPQQSGSTPQANTQPAEQTTAPKVVFPVMEHDFGDVWVGEVIRHAYEIKNEGDAPLKILKVKPSCGCTVADEYDREIAAGGVGYLPVTIKTERLHHGKNSKTIQVSTNDPVNPITTLRIGGTVKHYVEVSPPLVRFPTLMPKEEQTQSVTLVSHWTEPVELTLSKSEHQGFEAELVEKVPGKEFELVVHAKPPYREGRNRAIISVDTNIPQQKNIRVTAWANVLARIDVAPDRLFLGSPVSTEIKRQIVLKNNGNAPVHVVEATSSDEKIKLETVEKEEGKQYVVIATLPPDYKPESNTEIILKLDDAEKPELRVPIQERPAVSKSRQRPAMELEGKEAPELEFTTQGGQKINTHKPSDKALALFFYATWCPHCKKTLPELEKIYQEYKDKGVRLVAVSLDDPNDKNPRKRFTVEQIMGKLKEYNVTYDAYIDAERTLGSSFKVTSFPTSFIIDQSGKVTTVRVGGIYREDVLNSFRTSLNEAIGSEGKKPEGSQAQKELPGTAQPG